MKCTHKHTLFDDVHDNLLRTYLCSPACRRAKFYSYFQSILNRDAGNSKAWQHVNLHDMCYYCRWNIMCEIRKQQPMEQWVTLNRRFMFILFALLLVMNAINNYYFVLFYLSLSLSLFWLWLVCYVIHSHEFQVRVKQIRKKTCSFPNCHTNWVLSNR